MFRPLTSRHGCRAGSRRGAILIVVLALLALFAVIGISFVYYAGAEADTARIHREGASQADPDSVIAGIGTDTANAAIGELIFGTANVQSGLRGHDLMSNMYGGQVPIASGPLLPPPWVPFNGIGTFHEDLQAAYGVPDRAYWVNNTPVTINGSAVLMDPEWTGTRPTVAGPAFGPGPNLNNPLTYTGRSYIPSNAPYTYPDRNNLWLATLSPATGEVVVPSFYRSWIFRDATSQPATATGLEPAMGMSPGPNSNVNWINGAGRAMILRPRPVDNLTAAEILADGLPYPLPANPTSGPSGQQQKINRLIATKVTAGELIAYPSQNPDGSYTGDVQNLGGGFTASTSGPATVYSARNDSILLDPGAAPRLWNGKWVKPLIAALVTDLDGRLNYNAHGSGTSYAGYGPWELNLGPVLGADANAIVSARYGPVNANRPYNRAGANARYYDEAAGTGGAASPPRVRLPLYSAVNWNGSATGAIALPGAGSMFQTSPVYPNGFTDNVGPDHATWNPSLYNVDEWSPGGAAARSFSVGDARRLNLRYADRLDVFQGMDVAGSAPSSLVRNSPSNAGPSYRIDYAHANRLSVTPLSVGHDRPGLMPNFNTTSAGFLSQAGLHATNPVFMGTFSGGLGSDYTSPTGGTTDWRNQRASLGPIDLNRPLADYRGGATGNPLSTGTVTAATVGQAWADRHNLARDIFGRLIIATGANATVYTETPLAAPLILPGDITINAVAGTPDYDALRYLAQIAANIVDYIDKDDISTAFAWNVPPGPSNPGGLTVQTAAAVAGTVGVADTAGTAVFGVEKPRLVINEAYSEITNDPSEAFMPNMPARRNASVRFWVELMNPTSNPYPGAGPFNDMLGDGSATLHNGTFNPYRLQITPVAGNVVTNLADPANAKGDIGGGAPRITFNFSPAAGIQRVVAPANNAWGSSTSATATNGFIVVGPAAFTNAHTDTNGNPIEFNPNTGAAPYSQMIVANGADPMEYGYGSIPTAANMSMQSPGRHVVVLQRLANPYQPAGPGNPYITVDYMDYVPAWDGVARGSDPVNDLMNRRPKPIANGFDPVDAGGGATRRYAVGKVQPYAGYARATAPAVIDGFPTSAVIAQNPTTPTSNGEPMHTFFRNNGRADGSTQLPPAAPTYTTGPLALTGGETIMAPFDWYVHFDRPLANQLELLQVRSVKPHEVTQYFLQPSGTRNLGIAPWFGVDAGGNPGYDATNNRTNNGLFRALDLLRVKPWGYGVGLGGRVHGRVNINTIQDQRVWRGVVDDTPAKGNVPSGFADMLWTSYIGGSRTVTMAPNKYLADGTQTLPAAGSYPTASLVSTVPVPGPTVDDMPFGSIVPGPYDRPFKPLGVAELAPNSTFAFASGSGLRDTILRPAAAGGTTPQLWLSPNNESPGSYLQAEAARKLANNVTTVSNAFAVHLTVVFHEVRVDAAGNMITANENGVTRYLLGKEAFREVPGDLRQQYFAVVDRTNIGLAPGGTFGYYAGQPFSTSIESIVTTFTPTRYYLGRVAGVVPTVSPSPPGNPGRLDLYSDGKLVSITRGTPLVVGVGASQEIVTVATIESDGGITLAGLSKPHAAGENVSNVLLGNPGPQPGFDRINNPSSGYAPCVPYAVRIR